MFINKIKVLIGEEKFEKFKDFLEYSDNFLESVQPMLPPELAGKTLMADKLLDMLLALLAEIDTEIEEKK